MTTIRLKGSDNIDATGWYWKNNTPSQGAYNHGEIYGNDGDNTIFADKYNEPKAPNNQYRTTIVGGAGDDTIRGS